MNFEFFIPVLIGHHDGGSGRICVHSDLDKNKSILSYRFAGVDVNELQVLSMRKAEGTLNMNVRLSFIGFRSSLQFLLEDVPHTEHAYIVLAHVAGEDSVEIPQTDWAVVPEELPLLLVLRTLVH